MRQVICPDCHGNGYVMDSDGEQSTAIDCETCDNQGEISEEFAKHLPLYYLKGGR
tara:strand:+ start:352 stop:516 length:165 start_codon:yes stop_codon:yes gene_type:complete